MSAPYVYTPVERASRKLGLFLLLMVGVLLTVALFYVKTGAKEARAEVVRLERQLASERAAVDVLRAERAVLSSPDRLRGLSRERLGLEPIRTADTRASIDAALLEVTP